MMNPEIARRMANAPRYLEKLSWRTIEELRCLHYYRTGDKVVCLDLNLTAPTCEDLDIAVRQRLSEIEGGDVLESCEPKTWMDFTKTPEIQHYGMKVKNVGVLIVSVHGSEDAGTC